MSGKVMNDFYSLAAEYGKRNGFNDAQNPFYKKAEEEANNWFGYSYSLSWFLRYDAKSKSRYKNRLVILTYEGDEYSFIGCAIGVVKMYTFFCRSCDKLRSLLSVNEAAAA